MGMAASQVRFLSLQSRKNTISRRLSSLSNQKMALSRDMSNVALEFNNAMNKTSLQWSNDSGNTYETLSYNNLMQPSDLNATLPYIVTDGLARTVVNNDKLTDRNGGTLNVSYTDIAKMLSSYSGYNSTTGELNFNNLSNLVTDSASNIISGYGSSLQTYKNSINSTDYSLDNLLRSTILNKLGLVSDDDLATEKELLTQYVTMADTVESSSGGTNSSSLVSNLTRLKNALPSTKDSNGNYKITGDASQDSTGNNIRTILDIITMSDDFTSANGELQDFEFNLIDKMAKAFETGICKIYEDDGNIQTQESYVNRLFARTDEGIYINDYSTYMAYGYESPNNTLLMLMNGGTFEYNQVVTKYYGMTPTATFDEYVYSAYVYNKIDISNDISAYNDYYNTSFTKLGDILNDMIVRLESEEEENGPKTIDNPEKVEIREELDKLYDKRNSKIIEYYDALFVRMEKSGWVIDNTTSTTNANSNTYLNNKFQNNDYFITECKPSGGENEYRYTSKIASNISNIYTVHDSNDETKAFQEYETKKTEIENKETIIDTRMEKLETEQECINTELESIQEIISDNIKKKFKMFS